MHDIDTIRIVLFEGTSKSKYYVRSKGAPEFFTQDNV